MSSRRTIARPVSGVLLTIALCACRPAEAGAELAAAADGAQGPELRENRTTASATAQPEVVWWLHPTVNGGVAACIGRVVEDAAAGPVRPWTLTCALAGTTTPMAGLEGSVPTHSAESLLLEGSFFTVELRPRAGLAWEDVRAREDLETFVIGLD